MVEIARRSFLKGLGAALFVAPAIVRASSLMPVKVIKPLTPHELLGEWFLRMRESNHLVHELKLVPDSFNVLLEARLNHASTLFARNLRDHLDTIVYKTGSGGSGGLNELFA